MFLTTWFLQAFNTVLDNAQSGSYPNISADDVRAVVTLGFFNTNPDFAALNDVLSLAVNGNSSSLFYDVSTFTQNYASVLPIACLDTRKSNVVPLFDAFLIPISN
jgi:hypothetical protein